MKKILILAIMVLGLNTNVFAWYNMLEAAQADEIAYSKKPSEMTKKRRNFLKNMDMILIMITLLFGIEKRIM